MKKIFKVENLKISNKVVKDFLTKNFLIFVGIYFGFFLIEAILPGVIYEVFNLNLLLAFVLFNLLFLLIFTKGVIGYQGGWLIRFFSICCISLFLLVVFVVLYKLEIKEASLYVLLVIFLLIYLYDYLS